ncbi:hypothetical protein E6B08_10510 [Pseudomonas putida]|uniref:Uncharacterized protein n=1 Tax=Pseudomonas putida TaxID=303 RepID=A0A4D6X6X9_PSEPU|nr:hypothetical protein [Pseudomonas putida]QCI11773.1 hypothetical protein E6B08_10510 [Pseudomonas putida]
MGFLGYFDGGDSAGAMSPVPAALREQVGQLAEAAFVSGFGQVLLVAGLAGLLAAVVVGVYLRRPLPA